MKKILVFAMVAFAAFTTTAQELKPVYTFTPIKNNAAVETEDQCQTGTCWSFATISFLESEILRKGNKPVDLSEMYNVRMTYPEKAKSYVRYQGKQQFGPGGLSHDVINVLKNHGIMPEASYSGLLNGNARHDHGALDAALEGYVKTVVDKKLNAEGDAWINAVNGMLDAFIGNAPAEFEYSGKRYNAASFRDAMGLNADDYVSITSFSHHPFNKAFVLEVPDNWAKGSFYNLPLDEMQQVVDNAIDNGFTIAWDADVSERGFSFKNGVAILPEKSVTKDELFKKVVPEASVDQASRQKAYEEWETTDDHLMHITGKAKDQNGVVYYQTKNSWGVGNSYGGYQYVSTNYLKMKTVGIVVHKDAIPKAIRTKLGI